MKKKCALCGEFIDTEDCELDEDADGFIIKCPKDCILFNIKFEDIDDLEDIRNR